MSGRAAPHALPRRALVARAAIALAASALLACSGGTTRGEPPASAPTPAAPSLRHLTLIATNDFHGALHELPDPHDATRAWGGLPWLAAAIDAVRAEGGEVLYVDGGDQFQGSWPVNATRGMGATLAMNLLGLDATCVGNHEFDYGPGVAEPGLRGALLEAGRAARFAWLSANIRHADSGERWQPEPFAPWTIIERGGVHVGVIGLSTQETPQTTLFRHVADLEFTDPVEAVREGIDALRADGAEVIVVTGHITGACGTRDFSTLGQPCELGGEIQSLMEGLPRGAIDVIVAGHEHAVMFARVDDTFVIANGAQGRFLGRIDLAVGPDGVDPDATVLHAPWPIEHARVDPGCEGSPFPLAPLDVGGRTLAPDADAVALVEQLEAEAGSLCDPIGCAARNLGRGSQRASELGNFSADAMLAAMPGADLALTNSGGLRADLPEGIVRRESLQAVMPFENRLLLVALTGTQLERLLRIGSSGQHGVFQVAGARYRYDPEAEGGDDLDGDDLVDVWESNRLCWVEVGGQPLDREATYGVVMTDFIFTGGDHSAAALAGARVLEEGALMRDALIDFAASQHECLGVDVATVDEAAPRIELGPCPGGHQ